MIAGLVCQMQELTHSAKKKKTQYKKVSAGVIDCTERSVITKIHNDINF